MADFEITSPEGKKFIVTAPAGASQDDVLNYAKQQFAAKPAAPAEAPAAPKGPEPDQYHKDAQAEFDRLKAAGVPVEAGYGRRVAQGLGLGGTDEILAALGTPGEMIRRGTFNPVEGYNSAKAFEDVRLADARKRQGILGNVAELGGGIMTGGAAGKAGLTFAKQGAGILSRSARFGAEGAGYGAVQGALDPGEGDSRLSGAVKGGTMGAAVGGAMPAVTSVGGAIAAPILSNIKARLPGGAQNVASAQVARTIDETGRPVADIAQNVRQAAAEGQPMFTVADELGFPGSRLLRTAVSAQGPGRSAVVEALERRQAGQGRRISNFLTEGFEAPETATQLSNRLTEARRRAGDVDYEAVRGTAAPVDVDATIAKIDQNMIRPAQLGEHGTPIAPDSIEAALGNIRNTLTNLKRGKNNYDASLTMTDFDALHRTYHDIGDAIGKAVKAGENNKARLLGQVKDELGTALENASNGFAQANANFAARSRVIDAIETGSNAAKRGRTEDTIPAFRNLNPQQQQAYRVGYAEPYIEGVQGPASGANKARQFTSDAFKAESQAIAPQTQGNLLNRRLERENTMFNTRADATGGSRTDMNLTGQGEQAIDPTIALELMTGGSGIIGAGKKALSLASNALNGYTPAVREHMARLLQQAGNNPTLEAELAAAVRNIGRNRALAESVLRGAAVGGGYLPNAK